MRGSSLAKYLSSPGRTVIRKSLYAKARCDLGYLHMPGDTCSWAMELERSRYLTCVCWNGGIGWVKEPVARSSNQAFLLSIGLTAASWFGSHHIYVYT
jgi:hypothetical protein